MNIVSYKSFYTYCDNLCYNIATCDVNVDAICPVLRSGMIPGFKIAERLNLPVMINDEIYGGKRTSFDKRKITNVLIIDDSIHSGASILEECRAYKNKYNIYTACVIYNPLSKFKPDFFGIQVTPPRIFEWNMLNCPNSKYISFDMDGVLCRDPDVFDDDGLLYQECISTIEPLFLPTYSIDHIITNRIERWRPITEAWLKDHNITYNRLIMQKYKSAQARRNNSTPSGYKSQHYSKINSALFIESCDKQAIDINKLSKKPTYCMETNKFYGN